MTFTTAEIFRPGDRSIPRPRGAGGAYSVQYGVSMVHVFLMRQVFQVFWPIVLFGAVLVVDGHAIWSRSMKRFADQPMHKIRPTDTILAQRNILVTMVVFCCPQITWDWMKPIRSSDIPEVRCLINALKIQHWFPYFHDISRFVGQESILTRLARWDKAKSVIV